MSEIHVYTAEGVQAVHSEQRVLELLRAGELPPEAFYWRHGMADWQPLSTFRPALSATGTAFIPERRTELLPETADPRPRQTRAAAPSTSRKPGSSRPPRVRFRRYPEPLTTVLQIFLILAIILTGLNLANAVVRYNSLGSALPGAAPAPAVSLASLFAGPTELTLFYAMTGVTVTLLLPFFMWVYQANTNIHGFSSIVHFRRGWAVGCYFVPALNLYVPCQVMQEIWKVSRNPRSWQHDRGSVLVGIWWALWLLRVCAYLALVIFYVHDPSHGSADLMVLTGLILSAVQLVYYGVFFAMITVIVQAQKRAVEASRRGREAYAARTTATDPTL